MRRVLLLTALGFVLLAHTAQLSLIMLNIPTSRLGKLSEGWMVKVNHGVPDIATGNDGEGGFVRLRSRKASFALERGVDVDVTQYPYLSWRWKVAELPSGGDFRRASTDDQAAQVLVAFTDRRVLTYIWDSSAPKGTMQSASNIPLVRIYAVVCQSGASEANKWIAESRNIAADYERAYGKPAPRVKGLRLQINSQHTGTVAESYFGEVAFRVASGPDLCALLAQTAAQHSRGLMTRTDLAGHVGMLFVFSANSSDRFFMRNTPLPLSIAWFDAAGHFVSATDKGAALTVGGAGATHLFDLGQK